MSVVNGYTQFGGIHAETASLSNVLAAEGIRDPHTGKPFTEAMLFGIGGGLGAGYILWEFQEHHTKVLVLGFQHLWQYTTRFYQTLCDRIGVSITMPESGGRKAAAAPLEDAISKNKPVVAWVDPAHMPYLQLPESMKGHLGHLVTICGREGDDWLIDDRAAAPFLISDTDLADARARIGSYKNRLLKIEGSAPADTAAAIHAGLRACVEHLNSDSDSFSLPTIRKWSRMMTDAKNKKGWLNLFQDGRGLYSTLLSVYENITLTTGRGGLRGLYGDFLAEAAGVIRNPKLATVAARYYALEKMWLHLAEIALSDQIRPLQETKRLLIERHALIMQGGMAWTAAQPLTEQLRAMSREYNLAPPLTDAEKQELFGVMQERLIAIYDAEVEARDALARAI